MADWRVNEKYRKPRRTKGTPFYYQRNYYALGGLAFGALSWILFEKFWPFASRIKQDLANGRFDMPEGLKIGIAHRQAGPGPVAELLAKAREREIEKDFPKDENESWYSKVFKSPPPEI